MSLTLKAIAALVVVSTVIASYAYAERHGYNRGWAAAVAKVEAANANAENLARDAVQNLRRECARAPDECVRDDAWTRDSEK